MKILLLALLALSSPVTVLAAPAETALRPKSDIDARGVAALDKSIAFYRSQPSFSVAVRCATIVNGKKSPDVFSRLSLQLPLRAFLSSVTADDAREPLTVRFMNDTTVVHRNLSGYFDPVSIEFMDKTGKNRVLRTFFEESVYHGISPTLEHSIVALALGKNPARDASVNFVGYRESQLNGSPSEFVSLAFKTDIETTTSEYQLSAKSHALQKVVMRRQFLDEKGVFTAQFETPIFNWKGSQKATDAAIYNWKKLSPEIAIAPPKPKTKISVDPKARAIFGRAAKLYGQTECLHLIWRYDDGKQTLNNLSLDFDRAGRARVENSYLEEALVVLDGTRKWTLDKSPENTETPVHYTLKKIEDGEAIIDALMTTARVLGTHSCLSGLLIGQTPIDADLLENIGRNEDEVEYRAALLKPQPFGGQPCDIVRVTEITSDPFTYKSPLTTEQLTYWFARTDGRLMRVQERLIFGAQEVMRSDNQVLSQNFNPRFAPDTFKFVPPQGAVLAKD